MNNKFKEHTRSVAFSLSLSQPQIEVILYSSKMDTDSIIGMTHHQSTMGALERKGLMYPRSFKLTEEGCALSSLLVLVGFEV